MNQRKHLLAEPSSLNPDGTHNYSRRAFLHGGLVLGLGVAAMTLSSTPNQTSEHTKGLEGITIKEHEKLAQKTQPDALFIPKPAIESPIVNYITPQEKSLLYALVIAEIGDAGLNLDKYGNYALPEQIDRVAAMEGVIRVVYNRVKDPRFGAKSIRDAVFARGQFQPVHEYRNFFEEALRGNVNTKNHHELKRLKQYIFDCAELAIKRFTTDFDNPYLRDAKYFDANGELRKNPTLIPIDTGHIRTGATTFYYQITT